MAAEESSQGAALGPEFSESTGGNSPAKPDSPDLHEVLGEFMTALCVVEMVHRTLWALMEESSEDIGSCAVALRHGFQMLDAVYNRFDEGLRDYSPPGGNEPDDLDEDDADEDDEPETDSKRHYESAEEHEPGKQNRLAVVA